MNGNMAKSKSQNSLDSWTKEDWGTKSGKNSTQGKKASGEITLNGPAARKVAKGDIIIIISYATMDFEDAKIFEPSVIFPNETDNSLT